MRRLHGIALAAAALATILAAAGCGSSSPTSGPTTAGGMTVAQILAKSDQAMSKVTSASFTGDVTVKVSASGSSPQAALLGQAPIVLHLAGKAGHTGGKAAAKGADTAASMTMTLQAGGQTVPFGVKSVGGRTWLQFQGKWYVSPKSKKSGSKSLGATGGPTAGSLGIDPNKWAKSSTVTSEQLAGVPVYHVTATADTAQIMGDVVKALGNPALSNGTGSSAGVLNMLKSSGQLKSLEKSLAAASAQEWIDSQSFLVRKISVDAKLHFAGLSGSSGATGASLDITFVLGGFNQPVTVTPPAHALPLKKLTNGLSGLSTGTGVGL